MQKSSARGLILFLLIILIALPISAKKKKKVVVPPPPPTQEERIGRDLARKYQYFYIEAVRQQDMGNYVNSFELFRHCLDIDKDAPEAHYSVARYFAAFNLDSLARHHYERAVELEPHNSGFLESLGAFYLDHNEMGMASDLYERIIEKYPDRTELLEILLQIYQYKKDAPKVLSTLNRIETLEGPSEQLALSKVQIFTQIGDEDGAYQTLNDLCKAHPNDLNYQVMKGNWSLSHGKKEEALKTFKHVLAEEPDHAQAQMSLMDYYRADGRNEEADTLLYKMLENPKTEPSTRITLMRQVIKENENSGGDSTRILNIFHRVLSMPQKTTEMASMQAAYMEYAKMPKDSIRKALELVLSINPEDIGTRVKYISILWNDSIGQNVISECRKAIDYSPKESILYYNLGLALYINEMDEDALIAFRNGVANITENTPTAISSDMYMLMGDVLHKMGRNNEAFAAYDSCLVYNPNEVSCLNNYAYFLSEEGKDLKRAEQMSYRTIKAEPNSCTYLDTYAWILYKLERYEEAKIYINQALRAEYMDYLNNGAVDTALVDTADCSMDVEPETVANIVNGPLPEVLDYNSPTLLEHAGDIHLKTDGKEEALRFYRAALAQEPENKSIKKKIQNLTTPQKKTTATPKKKTATTQQKKPATRKR